MSCRYGGYTNERTVGADLGRGGIGHYRGAELGAGGAIRLELGGRHVRSTDGNYTHRVRARRSRWAVPRIRLAQTRAKPSALSSLGFRECKFSS